MKQIIVEVSPAGELKIETRGFVGKACLEESQFLKDLLGQETAMHLTPAYYRLGRTVAKKHLKLCG